MDPLKKVLIIIAIISFATFVALFGRLPAFRKTPIGWLHRFLLGTIPRAAHRVDVHYTGGKVTLSLSRVRNYLMHENHPIILIFFVGLLLISECLFIPPAWSLVGPTNHILIPIVALTPYYLIYACATSTSSMITPQNHFAQMRHYPYDHTLFYPNHICRTCNLLKPARSKHCSICKACIARHDHHCIWVRNCIGRGNYGFFISLLFSLSVLLLYGATLGFSILSTKLAAMAPKNKTNSTPPWSSTLSWPVYLDLLADTVANDIRIGAITLLSAMTLPLAAGFLLYHTYLIWAGMTTNESGKWADWRDDIKDHVVFRAKSSAVFGPRAYRDFNLEPRVEWPLVVDQILVRTMDGRAPEFGRGREARLRARLKDGQDGEDGYDEDDDRDPVWIKVRSLDEVHNSYDLGFWDNFLEIFRIR
ncbi:MAG: palmitoyltransferase swf1 [Cirrosporium novae-zelandiae]|nr:MAG: palmitoyltransferase swf1 [Cirrosporium novae-zelandiae]